MSSQRSQKTIENPTLEQLFTKMASRRWQNTIANPTLEQLFSKMSSQRWPKTIASQTLGQIFSKMASRRWQNTLENPTLEQLFSKRSSQRWQKTIEKPTLEQLFSKMTSRRLQNAIENQTLELKIISASDVRYIDAKGKMDVYAVVSMKDEYTQKKQAAKTPIDYDGGSNPTWNHTVKFSVNEKAAGEGLLTVKVKLYSYWLEGNDDLYLGEVNVSLQELLASNPLPRFDNVEAKPNAKLSFSYRFNSVKDTYPNPGPTGSCQPVIYSPQLQTNTVTKLSLELVIKCAKDIEKVTNILDEMDVYALVTIRDRKKTVKHRSSTPVVFCAYQNPKWDHAVEFSLDEPLARDGSLTLFVELMSLRPFLGDKQIGQVNVSIQELLRLKSPLTNGDNDMMLVTETVSGSYGKRGTLSFTYRFLAEQVTLLKPSPSTNRLPVSHQTQQQHSPPEPLPQAQS
ncbi:hypothetical protein Bca52824_018315 [Brassica carinata]|uniref:C2 domain-containing protein n=1 Tax=Brassica carinata TaxID=52824 RepID=A0A8X7VQ87_BRACI|nr:hypothetical protein Bca52824_018315 [Brassica carinata]